MAEEAYIIVLKPPCENSTEETLYWGYLQGILENINILNVCERSVCITVFASFFFFFATDDVRHFYMEKTGREARERTSSFHSFPLQLCVLDHLNSCNISSTNLEYKRNIDKGIPYMYHDLISCSPIL